MCDYLDGILAGGGEVVIDHAFVPVRDLYSAAESRRYVSGTAPADMLPDQIPGGLWHTKIPDEQETVLTVQLYKLIYTLVKYDVPLTLLLFPRIVTDPKYLYQKISFVLGATNYDTFFETFRRVSHPELVHAFTKHGTR